MAHALTKSGSVLAFRRQERIQQVSTVAGNLSEMATFVYIKLFARLTIDV